MATFMEPADGIPMLSMTLKGDTEFPRALKDIMLSLGLHGEAVYEGFTIWYEGRNCWIVQLHMYAHQGDNHEARGLHVITNPTLEATFFDAARDAAWEALKKLGTILCIRLYCCNDPVPKRIQDSVLNRKSHV
jgi:hypothetical protein